MLIWRLSHTDQLEFYLAGPEQATGLVARSYVYRLCDELGSKVD